MVTKIELFEYTDLTPLDYFVGLLEEGSLQNEGGYTDELLDNILKKREDQLRRTTRDHRTLVAKCTEVDVGISERLLWTVTISFPCDKSAI